MEIEGDGLGRLIARFESDHVQSNSSVCVPLGDQPVMPHSRAGLYAFTISEPDASYATKTSSKPSSLMSVSTGLLLTSSAAPRSTDHAISASSPSMIRK